MRILGVDPGLATIGLGLLEHDTDRTMQAIDWLTITTAAGLPLSERLAEIHRDFSAYLEEQKPELAVVEQLFFASNESSALAVAHARGIVLLALAERSIPIVEATPLQLKSCITGDGRADKRQMQDMLCHLLSLDELPRPDDAADALALAIYGGLHARSLLLKAC